MKRPPVVLLLSIFLVSGCSGLSPSGKEVNGVEAVNCVAVTPVIAYSDDTFSEKQSRMLKEGAVYVTEVMTNLVKDNPRVRLVDEDSGGFLTAGTRKGWLGITNEIGEYTGCQAVLLTTLKCFAQRQGSDMAVDKPASAAFEMTVIKVPSGAVLWAGEFQETQEPFLANIFSGKMGNWGFRWVTVEELVEKGVQERLAECPYLQ